MSQVIITLGHENELLIDEKHKLIVRNYVHGNRVNLGTATQRNMANLIQCIQRLYPHAVGEEENDWKNVPSTEDHSQG